MSESSTYVPINRTDPEEIQQFRDWLIDYLRNRQGTSLYDPLTPRLLRHVKTMLEYEDLNLDDETTSQILRPAHKAKYKIGNVIFLNHARS